MSAFNFRKVFALVFVLGGLAVVCLGSWEIFLQRGQEPVEGAGRLAEAGSRGVTDVPEVPEAPEEDPAEEAAGLVMTASYYGPGLEGLPTASGEIFDPEKRTAAHKSLPLGTELLVKRGDESVKVIVNDRGPYIAGRELDLSEGAAEEIGLIGPGEDEVEVILV